MLMAPLTRSPHCYMRRKRPPLGFHTFAVSTRNNSKRVSMGSGQCQKGRRSDSCHSRMLGGPRLYLSHRSAHHIQQFLVCAPCRMNPCRVLHLRAVLASCLCCLVVCVTSSSSATPTLSSLSCGASVNQSCGAQCCSAFNACGVSSEHW